MKIRITEPGWAGFTGPLGMVEFVDGVSVDDVSRADAAQLSAIVSVENIDTGKSPSVAQQILDNYGMEAATVSTAVPEVPKAPAAPVVHTKETLEAVADKSGIKGLREIADPLNVKGNAIAELIEKILDAAAVKAAGEKAAAEAAAQKPADEAGAE